uniref:GHMP_kinases_N domain-containing protein n=1 Tax=Heterorhabditis bacteriophora TaxID=37862 RepID=A0A1I7WVP5_HETBA
MLVYLVFLLLACLVVTDAQSQTFNRQDRDYRPLQYSVLSSVEMDQLCEMFIQNYGTNPTVHVSCPGRVNLIGSVPESSGLSSSSSIVCAAALTTWTIHTGSGFDGISSYKLSREELAELCAFSEQYVGTHGGGMDQACEILSEEGRALHINFNPLRFQTISLPQSALFVVLHCGQTINKAATSQFNQRVVEGRIAARVSSKKFMELTVADTFIFKLYPCITFGIS